ncbi:hypothetical protein UQW22_09905 [Isoptericola halotolerans]|uniref:hypothetical protein n=1 Tax=Isoptericola halotolerans TaxID=300560 RepID=UPI00388D5913
MAEGLATTDDVAVALERELTATEDAKADAQLIPRASDQVIGYLGCDPSDPGPIPATVTAVVAEMVARSLQQASSSAGGRTPVGAEQMTRSMGPFSETYGFGSSGASSGGTWLTASDKAALKPYRCNGGMQVVDLASNQTGLYRTRVGR